MMNRGSNKGFTIIELLVGLAMATLVVVLALGFASQQIRALHLSEDSIEIHQSGRLAIDFIADDLSNAGASVGYSGNAFRGLRIGAFDVGGGVNFSTNGGTIDTASGTGIPTMDLGIMSATGSHHTILTSGVDPAAPTDNADITVCGPAPAGGVPLGPALMRTNDGFYARGVRITAVGAVAACPACLAGCMTVTVDAVPDLVAGLFPADDRVGLEQNYEGGFLATGFDRIVYFVLADGNPTGPSGTLRRFSLRDPAGGAAVQAACALRDETCGEAVANNVESLLFRVSQLQAGVWAPVADQTQDITTTNNLRVSVELALRSRGTSASAEQAFEPAQLRLLPLANPGGFGANRMICLPAQRAFQGPAAVVDVATNANAACPVKDNYRRTVFRSTVELKNSSRNRTGQ